jgi:formylglycine-generating enzyme required for sulfatase activity
MKIVTLNTGQILNNRYRIVRHISRSNMGGTYQGWDSTLNVGCLLQEDHDTSLVAQNRFSQAARVLSRLQHPNLPRVTDYFVVPELGQYLVMDWTEGEDLQTMSERTVGLFPMTLVLDWICQVCDGLTYLHMQDPPVVHGRVQPGAIKITPDGRAKLVDLGVARVLDYRWIAPTLIETTPGYSPPEQYGEGKIDPQSDIYALGATLYTLLTGQAPASSIDIMGNTTPPPAPADAINPAVPGKLAAVVERAMQLEASARFDRVDDFKEAVKRYIPYEAQPAIVKPVGMEKKPIAALSEKPTHKGKGWLLGGIILAFVAILCLAVTGFFGYRTYHGWSSTRTVQAIALLATRTPTMTVTVSPTIPIVATATKEITLTPANTPTSSLGIGSTKTWDKDGMVSVFVPAGEFMMGAGSNDSKAENDEKPQHKVMLDAFWIDRTEVTNAMYALCVQARVCRSPLDTSSATRGFYFGNAKYDNFPVIYVRWVDAQAYCGWSGRRLPTEAEWEKAARGIDQRIYPWGNELPKDKITSLLNSGERTGDTTAVGSYPQGVSFYGALDMAGNVLEWAADWFAAYNTGDLVNPLGPSSGGAHVVRGGSWWTIDELARTTNRAGLTPGENYDDLGFRCAASP